MERTDYTIALLIDCENISAKYISAVNKELILFGRVTYKRMYGDFTGGELSSWKEMVNEYAITPIQQFSYTSGKNATDSKIIIDAMDILYSGKVDAFCIMSSDSDYTGLVKRLKESDSYVIGAGEEKTPRSFVNACDRFFDVKVLREKYGLKENSQEEKGEKTTKDIDETKPIFVNNDNVEENAGATKEEIENFAYHFIESLGRQEAPLEKVMSKIYQAYPDFSLAKYGVKKSYDFFSKDRFWTARSKNGPHMFIGICEDNDEDSQVEYIEEKVEIEEFFDIDEDTQQALVSTAKKILRAAGKSLAIGMLCEKIYKDEEFSTKSPGFKFKKGLAKSFFAAKGFIVAKNEGGTVFVALP